MANAGAKTIDKNSEEVNETKAVESDTAVTMHKSANRKVDKTLEKMLLRTAIFRSNKSSVKLQPEAVDASTTENLAAKRRSENFEPPAIKVDCVSYGERQRKHCCGRCDQYKRIVKKYNGISPKQAR